MARLDRNATTPERIRRNWQRLRNGAATLEIDVTPPLMNNGSIFLALGTAGGLVSTSQTLGIKLDGSSLVLSEQGLRLGVMTAKGDLISRSTTAPTRLPVGSNGTALFANSGTTTGLEWRNVAISDVTNLQTTLNAKADASALSNHIADDGNPHGVTASQVGAYTTGEVDGIIAGLTYSDVGAAAAVHDHDDRYYTESEIDSFLGGKQDNLPLTTKGDVLTHDGVDLIRVGVGADGQVLTADSGEDAGVKWADPTGGDPLPLTTRGDLVTHDGDDPVRLPIGADGTFLRSDGTDLIWQPIEVSDVDGMDYGVFSPATFVGGGVTDANVFSAHYLRVGTIINVSMGVTVTVNTTGQLDFEVLVPVLRIGGASGTMANGVCANSSGTATGNVLGSTTSAHRVVVRLNYPNTGTYGVRAVYQYSLI